MKIYFATWLYDRTLGNSLTRKKANTRLISYYFIKDQEVTDDQLLKYVKTGRLDTRKNKT